MAPLISAQSHPEPPQSNIGTEAHGMFADEAACSDAVAADQGGNLRPAAVGRGQGLVHFVLHHGGGREVAIVATEAGEHPCNIGRVGRHAGGQHFNESSATGGDGLAIETGDIFAPENGITRGRGVECVGFAIARCTAVRRMTCSAATAVVEMGAEDVGAGSGYLSGGDDGEREQCQWYERNPIHETEPHGSVSLIGMKLY